MNDKSFFASQDGFSIVTALFILLVLAFLGGIMATMSGVQSRTSLWAFQGAQAYHAARSGLEWGIAIDLSKKTCADDASFSVGDFKVTVTCAQQSFSEGDQTYNVYDITSLAEWGTFGNGDYVSRQLRARVTGARPL